MMVSSWFFNTRSILFFFLPHLFRVFFDFPRVHPIALFHPSFGTWITGRFCRRLVLFRLLFHHHVRVCVCLHNIDYFLSRVLTKKRFKASSNQKKGLHFFTKSGEKKAESHKISFAVSSWRVTFLHTNFTRWIHTRARIYHTKRASSSLTSLLNFLKRGKSISSFVEEKRGSVLRSRSTSEVASFFPPA